MYYKSAMETYAQAGKVSHNAMIRSKVGATVSPKTGRKATKKEVHLKQ